MTDINQTLAERGNRYGQFHDHAFIAQNLKKVMWGTPGWQRLADDQKQALEVIGDKIARILNGDPQYIDNWHDIIGYAKLVENRLVGMQPAAIELNGDSMPGLREAIDRFFAEHGYTLGILRADEV